MLTYTNKDDYNSGHIRDYIKKVKQCLGDNLLGFAWVAEIQPDRGAIHYHVMILAKLGTRIPKPDVVDNNTHKAMWSFGWSGIHTARSPWYLLKYAGKERQKDLSRYPKSCRLYSASLRLPGDEVGVVFKVLSGLGGKGKSNYVSDWEYKGSTVTERYAKEVILPSDTIID
jgi:hypothetical protein